MRWMDNIRHDMKQVRFGEGRSPRLEKMEEDGTETLAGQGRRRNGTNCSVNSLNCTVMRVVLTCYRFLYTVCVTWRVINSNFYSKDQLIRNKWPDDGSK